jgi:hypothetical protein
MKIMQAIILSIVPALMYLAGVKLGSGALLTHLLASKGVRLAERSCDLGASTPDREHNLEDGVRRLTKVQHECRLRPLESSRHTTIARALDDSTTHR